MPIILLIPVLAEAGVDRDIRVAHIVISGNRVTHESVILREMTHRIGVPFNSEILSYERDRIYSLGLFNRVDIGHRVEGDSAVITIQVHERWYIFPVPLFGMRDRDWSKLYYGLGVVHNNFRGRNEKLWAGFALGYDPWVSLFYSNPSILGRNDIFLESQAIFARTQNKSVFSLGEETNFNEYRYALDFIVGKRFTLYSTLSLLVGYRGLRLSEYVPGHTVSTDGFDSYLLAGVTFRYDTRDLFEYPMSGTHFRTSVFKSGFGEGEVDNLRVNIDARRYVPLSGRISIAARAMTSMALGRRIPRHSHVYIGYDEKIRGHFKSIFEGENSMLGSLEARFRLFGPDYIEWKSALAPEFSVLRYGLNAALFFDTGTTWFRSEDLGSLKPVKGFGGGLHFLLPYSLVFRVEYAFNERYEGEFIFDLNVSF